MSRSGESCLPAGMGTVNSGEWNSCRGCFSRLRRDQNDVWREDVNNFPQDCYSRLPAVFLAGVF